MTAEITDLSVFEIPRYCNNGDPALTNTRENFDDFAELTWSARSIE